MGHTERAVLHAEEGAAGVLHREASVLEAPPRGLGRDARDLAAHTPAHHVVVRDAEEEGDGASAPEPVPSRHRVGPTRGDGLNLSHVSGRDGGASLVVARIESETVPGRRVTRAPAHGLTVASASARVVAMGVSRRRCTPARAAAAHGAR